MKKSLLALAFTLAAGLAFALPASPPGATAGPVVPFSVSKAEDIASPTLAATAAPVNQHQTAIASAPTDLRLLPGDATGGCGRGIHPMAGKGKGGGKKPPKCIEASFHRIQGPPTGST